MFSHASSPVGASTPGLKEAFPDPFLTELRNKLSIYTKNYLEEYTNATERLGDLLKGSSGLDLEPHGTPFEPR